jgi:hypothetical protein
VFGGGGTAAIVSALTRRRITRVEAADQLTDAVIELLNTVKADMRADMSAMRLELAEARREAAETRLALRRASSEAEQLTGYLQRVISAIHDPSMTIERLRVLVGTGPPNGAIANWVSHAD